MTISPAVTSINGHHSILTDLKTALNSTKDHFEDQHLRLTSFEQFSQMVFECLWSVYEKESYYHQRLVVALKSALRRVDINNLDLKQIDAFIYTLNRLGKSSITLDDIMDCDQHFRTSGINVLAVQSDETEGYVKDYIEQLNNNEA